MTAAILGKKIPETVKNMHLDVCASKSGGLFNNEQKEKMQTSEKNIAEHIENQPS